MPTLPAFLLIGQSNGNIIAPFLQSAVEQIYGLGAMVINACEDGSTIEEWQPEADNYERAVEMASDAQFVGFRIASVIFVHRESDAHAQATAKNYAANANHMLDSLRDELNLRGVPVIYSQLGTKPTDGDYLAWDTLRYQQHLMSWNRPLYYMVRQDGWNIYEPGRPYCHNTPLAAERIVKNQFMPYLRGFVK